MVIISVNIYILRPATDILFRPRLLSCLSCRHPRLPYGGLVLPLRAGTDNEPAREQIYHLIALNSKTLLLLGFDWSIIETYWICICYSISLIVFTENHHHPPSKTTSSYLQCYSKPVAQETLMEFSSPGCLVYLNDLFLIPNFISSLWYNYTTSEHPRLVKSASSV